MSSLLRSTKFVRYFAGAARTLILNSAKTAEANLLINSKVISVPNNALVRDYATAKKAESIDPLLQRLDLEVRRYGRISKRDIDEVYDEIRRRQDISSSQSLLVIRCCGDLVPEELPEQRTQLVQKIWSILSERGVPMDISHYNALLRVYIENEHPFSPAEFLEELEKKGLQPNRVTYQRMMWRYCQEGDVEGATKVLEKMRELNLPVSEPVLNALIMGHAFHGDTEGAKAVLDTMAGAGLQPSNRTYALLACGYAKKGDIEGIENVFKQANDKETFITDKDILDVIENLAVSGHADKVDSLFSHLQKHAGFNQDACHIMLRLINKGQEEVAKSLLKIMSKGENLEDQLYKGAFFIKQLVKVHKSPEKTIELCKELQTEGLIPNALYIATEASLQQGKTALAMSLFKEIKQQGIEIRQHYYWPLIVNKIKDNDEEGLMYILREMSSFDLTPSSECLREYVLPYLLKTDTPNNVVVKLQIVNIPRIHTAKNVIMDLLEQGKIKDAANVALKHQPNAFQNSISRPLLNALQKTKDVASFVSILHGISTKNSTDEALIEGSSNNNDVDTKMVGEMVKSAVKNIKPEQVDELLSLLLKKGLGINTESAEAIEQYLGTNLTSAISEKLVSLTSPDITVTPLESQRQGISAVLNSNQLEKMISHNKSKNLSVTRLQRQLLSAYVNEKNVEKLNSFLKELEQEDFELSNATLANLIEFYCENNQLDKALEYKQILDSRNDSFVLNKFKIIKFALAYVRSNKYDEAVQFLKDNRLEDNEGVSFLLNSKCWQLLNSLAEQKDVEKVKEMTKVLIENKYIEATNILLGPMIKVHMMVDDVEGALAEFENSAKQYRCTPWKGELMKALIMKEDATKLQWLADISTQIHGEVNILHDLVLAFVECGRLRQARRILETPGMQTRHRRLQDACERYVQDGKSEYLEGLLEATKELSHIDRSNIFYHLMVTYCKANETDKALGLWTLLQEENLVPSEEFLIYLGKHLKAQNRQVPFVIPETKQSKEPVQKITERVQARKETPIVNSEKIEKLAQEGQPERAMDLVLAMARKRNFPKHNVIKFVLKALAEIGNVDKIEEFGAVINKDIKRNVTYDDKLTLAIFNKGAGRDHINTICKEIETAKTDEDLATVIQKFPRSNALASILDDNDLVAKCRNFSEIAMKKGHTLPLNLLWMEFVITGKTKEADELWHQYLKDYETIAFRRLLQIAHLNNDPHLIEKLISYLKTNSKISEAAIGNVYSRLINLHYTLSNIQDAKEVLDKAVSQGTKLENLNRSTLRRLKEALETAGKEFEYTIPQQNKSSSSTS